MNPRRPGRPSWQRRAAEQRSRAHPVPAGFPTRGPAGGPRSAWSRHPRVPRPAGARSLRRREAQPSKPARHGRRDPPHAGDVASHGCGRATRQPGFPDGFRARPEARSTRALRRRAKPSGCQALRARKALARRVRLVVWGHEHVPVAAWSTACPPITRHGELAGGGGRRPTVASSRRRHGPERALLPLARRRPERERGARRHTRTAGGRVRARRLPERVGPFAQALPCSRTSGVSASRRVSSSRPDVSRARLGEGGAPGPVDRLLEGVRLPEPEAGH